MSWLIKRKQYIKRNLGKRAAVYIISQNISSFAITFTVIILYTLFPLRVNIQIVQFSVSELVRFADILSLPKCFFGEYFLEPICGKIFAGLLEKKENMCYTII